MLEFLNEPDDVEIQNKTEVPDKVESEDKKDAPGETLTKEVADKRVKKETSDEFISAKTGIKGLKRSTIALGVLFVGGLIGLFIMIKKGAPSFASAQTQDPQQAQIDAIVVKLGGVRSEMSNKMDTIVKKFYEFADVKQVSLDRLIKNPFRQTKVTLKASGKAANVAASMPKAKDFRLFSIMRSDADPNKWCCMINDKLFNVGQQISGMTVTQIGASFVILESADNKENKIILNLIDD